MKKRMLSAAALFFALCCLICISGCTDSGNENFIRTVGMFYGMPAVEKIAEESFTDAEIVHMDAVTNMMMSLKAGRLDAFCIDEPTYLYMKRTDSAASRLDEPLCGIVNRFVFPASGRGETLRAQFNEMLAEMKADGSFAALEERWFRSGEEYRAADLSGLTGENGVLKAGLDSGTPPYVMIIDGKMGGFEVDLLAEFCTRYGYKPEISDVAWTGMIAGIESGVFDIGGSNTLAAPEDGTLLESEPVVESEVVTVILGTSEGAGFGERLKNVLVRDGRLKLLGRGLLVTLFITLASCAAGTLLGFGLYMLNRRGSRLIGACTRIYLEILTGVPAVLVLMFLYYSVFRGMGGIAVSVTGFTLLFAPAVMRMIGTGVDALDPGQYRAALALGFTDRKAFMKVVFPQAVRLQLPAFRDETVALIKATAVVGYITVQDLTRASDIIRTRTLDAFLPLAVSAVLYYALIKLTVFLMDRAAVRLLRGAPDREGRKRG